MEYWGNLYMGETFGENEWPIIPSFHYSNLK